MTNKEIASMLKGMLEPSYTLVCVDYRDELPPSILKECLEKKSLAPLYAEDVYRDATVEGAGYVIAGLIGKSNLSAKEIDTFKYSSEYDDLLWEIIENHDASNPEAEVFEKTFVHGYLRLQSNYDVWCPLRMTRGLNTRDDALCGIMAALSLDPSLVKAKADELGVPTAPGSRWKKIPARRGKEAVDYKAFVDCLYDTPCCGNWTFVGRFDMEALSRKGCDTGRMTIPKGTTCLIFDPWDGGGSYQPIVTVRDLAVRDIVRRQARYQDTLRISVDERGVSENYTTASVYGEYLSEEKFLQ